MLVGAAAGAEPLPPAEPANTPAFGIPRLDGIVIDGQPGDWGKDGFRVEALAALDGTVKPTSDLDARVRLGWDERGLLVLVTVQDDTFLENDAEDFLWQNDAVELYLADRRGGRDLVQAVVAPGVDGKHPSLRQHVYDHRKDEALRRTPPTVTAARTKTDGGYILEVLLPWDSVGLKPAVGVQPGFQIFVDDSDPQALRPFNLVWYPGVGTFMDTMRMHRLRLARKAGPPVLAVGRGSYDGLKATRVTVAGVAELAGKTITAKADGHLLARGTLTANGGRAVATLRGPIPAVGKQWKELVIAVDGRTIDTVSLPDLAALRERAIPRLPFVFRPFCFDGNRFPEGDFEDRLEAENALGPYTLRVTYCDATGAVVTQAVKPGRYSAIVEIQPENGPALKRFFTLYRLPQRVNWRDVKMPLSLELPTGLGIPPATAQEQMETLGGYVKDRLAESFARSPDSAIVLAWLSELAPGTRATRRNDPWSVNLRALYTLKVKTGSATPLPYLIRLPDAARTNTAARWPAILFLHGSGERDLSLESLGRNALVTYASSHTNFPFIVITPQCPKGEGWQAPSLDALYDEVVAKYPVDRDRVYLTGLSMGGYGSWMLAAEHPERFAAVAPICGGGDPREAEYLKDVPVWVFHGAKDPSVPLQRGQEMVAALRQIHGRVRFTVYPDGGHTIWDDVYGTDELYAWLLRQACGKPEQAPATEEGAKPSDERPLKNP